ncbi:MAG: PEP-CTERM sorting domain-containing protein [Pirellulales bacterium]|nr:PEP-CTERM sorting domain-containing protein [Pirellulales bacterium]
MNPVLPEVHAHINNVVQDIATNYEVDGIHLDYIRYLPAPTSTSFDRLPHDEISHQMFTAATGLDGSNPANVAAYRNFVEGRITDLVAGIKQTVDTAEVATDRINEFTASVWRDPDILGATLIEGDADGDDDVDGQDFLIWQQSINPVSGATHASAIPEPATWILFVVACLITIGRLRRR